MIWDIHGFRELKINIIMSSQIIDFALSYAKENHKGQLYGNAPYINHLLATQKVANKFHCSAEIQAARQNLKNRRTEILVVNYESPALYSLFRNQEQNLLLV